MKTVKKYIIPVLGVVGLLLLIVTIAGGFSGKRVPPGTQARARDAEPRQTVQSVRRVLPVWYDVVGTVHSVRRIAVSAQVHAQIAAIEKRAGEGVKEGDGLVRLDDAEFQSRMRQARQGVTTAQAGLLQAQQSLLAAQSQVRQMDAYRLQAVQTQVQTQAQLAQAEAGLAQAQQGQVGAQAKHDQAAAEYQRVKKFKEEGTSTQQQLEVAESGYKQTLAALESARQGVAAAQAQVRQLAAAVEQAKQGVTASEAQVDQAKAAMAQAREGVAAAEAQVKRAEEGVHETEIAIQYTVLKAPEDGVVAERLAEPGDLAWPGKPLLILHNPRRLRLEASVPESLLDRVPPQAEAAVLIDALRLELTGTVDEVAPTGDPRSRTFLVKVLLPEHEGLRPGMFGRLRIRQSERETVLAPAHAIRHVGQLATVQVNTDLGWRERLVRTGERINEDIEVLSGLDGGETLGVEGP